MALAPQPRTRPSGAEAALCAHATGGAFGDADLFGADALETNLHSEGLAAMRDSPDDRRITDPHPLSSSLRGAQRSATSAAPYRSLGPRAFRATTAAGLGLGLVMIPGPSWELTQGRDMHRAGVGSGEAAAADGGAALAVPANRPYQQLESSRGVLETTLTAQESPITFAGQTWSAMQYNGAYLPPVLRVQPGDSLKLHLVNRLPADQRTNVHYHGTSTSPKPPSDYVLNTIRASTSYDYALYFPRNHDRGLFWYHPHPHGQSEKQVQDGMSGLLVVEGFMETNYPWLRDVPERLLMLKDPEPPGRPDSLGHAKTINGEVSATFTIRPGELQFWRVGNIGADAYFNLKIDGHRMWLLANDANVVRKPLLVDSLYLPPGARAEVLIEGGAPGRHAIRHLAVNTGPAGDPNPTAPLGTLVVDGPRADRSADVARLRAMQEIPETAKEISDLRAHPITRRRTFVFSETADGDTFFINGEQFDMDSVNTRVKVGDVEEWTLVNTSGEWHAFHIHQLDFLVTEVNGVPQPGHSLHDTVNLPFAVGSQPGIVKVIMPFTDPNIVGRFVYHCHILEHEDGGMMQIIQVDPAAGRAAAKSSTRTHSH